jgi:hypothetical protein
VFGQTAQKLADFCGLRPPVGQKVVGATGFEPGDSLRHAVTPRGLHPLSRQSVLQAV